MPNPRIAVAVPTSRDTEYNRQSWRDYANALQLSGGEAVEVSLGGDPEEVRRIAASCDGILLPGSPADVDPQRYGASAIPASAGADHAREKVDVLLLEQAAASGKPILGICFGCQLLNVWSGGTLIQDLGVLPVNHAAGRSVAVAHTAVVATDSILASLLGNEVLPSGLRLAINSSHHQALATPGTGLRVVARCPEDGVIEAVERVGDPFVLGVQWHPERSITISAASRAIFDRFVIEASRWALGRVVPAYPLAAPVVDIV